jgi:hypothetical protein
VQYTNESKHYSISINSSGVAEFRIWISDESRIVSSLILPLNSEDIMELIPQLEKAYNGINHFYGNLGK